MGNLIIKCFNCGGKFKLYSKDLENGQKGRCPFCLSVMDARQFEKLENAFNTIEEVNYGLRRANREKGTALFQVGYEEYYVRPEKVCCEDI